jgi:hypothetical protein
MALLGELFTKVPRTLNNIYKETIWFQYNTNVKFSAQIYLKRETNSQQLLILRWSARRKASTRKQREKRTYTHKH